MAVVSPLQLSLTQRKVFTGLSPRTQRFAVQELVTPSSEGGAAAAAAFILGPAVGTDRERLLRMLDLSVPADVALPINPLLYFKDTVINVSSVAVPAVLRVGPTAPGEWDETGALPATIDYVIDAVDVPNQRVVMDQPFWWSASGLTWQIWNPGLTLMLASGTNGLTERFDPALLEWRADRFCAAYAESPQALDHITATQAFISSLSKQANVDPTAYLAMPPGNPINNTY